MHETPDFESAPPPASQEGDQGDVIEHGWLFESAPEYLARLHRGVVLVQGVIIVQLLLGLFYGAVMPGLAAAGTTLPAWVGYATSAVGFGLAGLLLWGWWLLCTPPEAGMSAARPWVRGLVLASALLVTVKSVLLFMGAGGVTPSGWPSVSRPMDVVFWSTTALEMIISVVAYFPQMLYLAWLALGVPDEWMRRRAMMLLWLGPLLTTVGILLLGLGPLIALVLYWNLLEKFRKAFRVIRGDQAAAGLAAA